MKIWIYIDGAQQGPFEISELPIDRMDSQTPVWHEGMAYWRPAAEVPETARLLGLADETPRQHYAYAQAQAQQQYAYNAQAAQQAVQPNSTEKCPPSYLVWSIILTILCCNPVGIVAIVLGSTVANKFRNYNYEGARRASEATAWWLMITIVTSLMSMPLSFLAML